MTLENYYFMFFMIDQYQHQFLEKNQGLITRFVQVITIRS